MKRAAICLIVITGLIAGCASTPSYPPPKSGESQVVVKVTATPKVGVKAAATEGSYDRESVETGKRFTRVNYSAMDCIAVVLSQGKGRSGLCSSEVELTITKDGFTRDLSLVWLGGTGGKANSSLVTIRNQRPAPLTLFGSTQGNAADQATFEIKVPANATAGLQLAREGLYDIYCDEDDQLFGQLIATSSAYCSLCESGGEVLFDGLEPGDYDVEVFAPRLPVWRMKLKAVSGERETLYAELTVNGLPKAK